MFWFLLFNVSLLKASESFSESEESESIHRQQENMWKFADHMLIDLDSFEDEKQNNQKVETKDTNEDVEGIDLFGNLITEDKPHCDESWNWDIFEQEILQNREQESSDLIEISDQPEVKESLLGLNNRGNTCYINAATVLVALTKLKSLLNLDHLTYNPLMSSTELSKKLSIQNSLYALLLGMKSKYESSHSERVNLYIAALKNAFEEKLGGDIHRQNDAAEFLDNLLESLNSSQKGFDLLTNEFTKNNKDSDTSFYERPYKMLSLPISNNKSLRSALLESFKEEELIHQLEGEESPKIFTKRSTLKTIPETFLIHLKRFEHTAFGLEKNQKRIKIPFKFKISTFKIDKKTGHIKANEEKKMRLKAIIVHTGSSIHMGHYKAYECLEHNGRNKLRLYDDSHVQIVSKQALEEIYHNAYILAYEEEAK